MDELRWAGRRRGTHERFTEAAVEKVVYHAQIFAASEPAVAVTGMRQNHQPRVCPEPLQLFKEQSALVNRNEEVLIPMHDKKSSQGRPAGLAHRAGHHRVGCVRRDESAHKLVYRVAARAGPVI